MPRFYSCKASKILTGFFSILFMCIIGFETQANGPGSLQTNTNTVVSTQSPLITTVPKSGACPAVCMKSGRCDRSCQTRYYGETQMIEKINQVLSQSLTTATLPPQQAVEIDKSKFCAREDIEFKTPNKIVKITNDQKFKGETSTHLLCKPENGYTAPPPPANISKQPIKGDEVTPDGCYRVPYTAYPEIEYKNVRIEGPVTYQCVEDEKTKRVSWKLVSGCKVQMESALVTPTRVVFDDANKVQIGCFQPPATPPKECYEDRNGQCNYMTGGENDSCASYEIVRVRVPCEAAPSCPYNHVATFADPDYKWFCKEDPCAYNPNNCTTYGE